MPPHTRHGGSASPARTRSSVSRIGRRSSQSQHRVNRTVPCTSITLCGVVAGGLVQPVDVLGDEGVQTTSALELVHQLVPPVRLGGPHRRVEPVEPGRTAHLRVGEVVLDVRRLLGGRVAGPDPFRAAKSGMPESVEMPAPVSTTIRSAAATAAAAAVTPTGTVRWSSGDAMGRLCPIDTCPRDSGRWEFLRWMVIAALLAWGNVADALLDDAAAIVDRSASRGVQVGHRQPSAISPPSTRSPSVTHTSTSSW
jgi:hypothetical protein